MTEWLSNLAKTLEESAETEEARQTRLIALGTIAERAANLEVALRSLIIGLIGGPRAGLITSGVTFANLVAMGQAIIKQNDAMDAPSLGDPDDVENFRLALLACKDVMERRNDALHGAWSITGTDQVLSKLRRPPMVMRAAGPELLAQLCDDLIVAHQSLIGTSFKISGLWFGKPAE